jgi:Leucine-rich repeat (LRR) protein
MNVKLYILLTIFAMLNTLRADYYVLYQNHEYRMPDYTRVSVENAIDLFRTGSHNTEQTKNFNTYLKRHNRSLYILPKSASIRIPNIQDPDLTTRPTTHHPSPRLGNAAIKETRTNRFYAINLDFVINNQHYDIIFDDAPPARPIRISSNPDQIFDEYEERLEYLFIKLNNIYNESKNKFDSPIMTQTDLNQSQMFRADLMRLFSKENLPKAKLYENNIEKLFFDVAKFSEKITKLIDLFNNTSNEQKLFYEAGLLRLIKTLIEKSDACADQSIVTFKEALLITKLYLNPTPPIFTTLWLCKYKQACLENFAEALQKQHPDQRLQRNESLETFLNVIVQYGARYQLGCHINKMHYNQSHYVVPIEEKELVNMLNCTITPQLLIDYAVNGGLDINDLCVIGDNTTKTKIDCYKKRRNYVASELYQEHYDSFVVQRFLQKVPGLILEPGVDYNRNTGIIKNDFIERANKFLLNQLYSDALIPIFKQAKLLIDITEQSPHSQGAEIQIPNSQTLLTAHEKTAKKAMEEVKHHAATIHKNRIKIRSNQKKSKHLLGQIINNASLDITDMQNFVDQAESIYHNVKSSSKLAADNFDTIKATNDADHTALIQDYLTETQEAINTAQQDFIVIAKAYYKIYKTLEDTQTIQAAWVQIQTEIHIIKDYLGNILKSHKNATLGASATPPKLQKVEAAAYRAEEIYQGALQALEKTETALHSLDTHASQTIKDKVKKAKNKVNSIGLYNRQTRNTLKMLNAPDPLDTIMNKIKNIKNSAIQTVEMAKIALNTLTKDENLNNFKVIKILISNLEKHKCKAEKILTRIDDKWEVDIEEQETKPTTIIQTLLDYIDENIKNINLEINKDSTTLSVIKLMWEALDKNTESLILNNEQTQGMLSENIGILAHLKKLYLKHNQLTDISALSQLTSLTKLGLSHNQLTDISALSQLTNLTKLGLNHNQLTDINALSQLTSITELGLSHNQFTDISPLSQLTNLTNLALAHNQLTDISLLSQLTSLITLSLNHNQFTDISPLSQLTNLTNLALDHNQITDMSPFSQLTNFTKLAALTFNYSQLTSISFLSRLTTLTFIGLNYNQLTDISPLSLLTNLTVLGLDHNQITNISPLSLLTNLTTLALRNNQLTDACITHLSQLTNLKKLYISDNQLTQAGKDQLKKALPNCQVYV